MFLQMDSDEELNILGNSQCILETPSPDIPETPSPNGSPSAEPSDLQASSSSDILDSDKFVRPQNSARKRIKISLPEHISKSIETLQSIKDQALNNKEPDDEFYNFGKNIACQLRQLPLLDTLDVQSEILNLIRIKRQSILRRHEQS